MCMSAGCQCCFVESVLDCAVEQFLEFGLVGGRFGG